MLVTSRVFHPALASAQARFRRWAGCGLAAVALRKKPAQVPIDAKTDRTATARCHLHRSFWLIGADFIPIEVGGYFLFPNGDAKFHGGYLQLKMPSLCRGASKKSSHQQRPAHVEGSDRQVDQVVLAEHCSPVLIAALLGDFAAQCVR